MKLSCVLLLKQASRTAYANAIGKHFEIDMEGLMEIVRGKVIKYKAKKNISLSHFILYDLGENGPNNDYKFFFFKARTKLVEDGATYELQ